MRRKGQYYDDKNLARFPESGFAGQKRIRGQMLPGSFRHSIEFGSHEFGSRFAPGSLCDDLIPEEKRP